ncbi:MAG: hypothetical protein QOF36_2544 [Microbacteriaceae bacterium]|jgi:hypothetical protein|nr:hypothetical protein [Microbacteriaceae bacterium]
MDNVIFNTLKAVRSEENAERRAELMERSNAELAQHFSRPQNQADLQELAFDLLNNAWNDTTRQDILPDLIDVKTVGFGSVDYVNENLYGMRAYWQGPGGQILSDVLRYSRTTMPRDGMVAAIDLHDDEIATDFWGTFQKLSAHASEKLALLPAERLVELIQRAVTSGAYFGSFAASTLTAAEVDSVLDNVALKSAGKVSIVGTRYAIRKLANIGLAFGPNVQERVFDSGQIGVYKGYPVVQLDNEQENFEGQFALPNDELWLVGRNAGRLTYYGNEAKVQTLQRSGFYKRWETERAAGMLLYGADFGRLGRIKLT